MTPRLAERGAPQLANERWEKKLQRRGDLAGERSWESQRKTTWGTIRKKSELQKTQEGEGKNKEVGHEAIRKQQQSGIPCVKTHCRRKKRHGVRKMKLRQTRLQGTSATTTRGRNRRKITRGKKKSVQRLNEATDNKGGGRRMAEGRRELKK